MLTFHNDQSIKDKYLKRLQDHYDADEFIKGKYWENGKGCAVGCTIHSSDHYLYEEELGIPTWAARLEDKIFEGLPNIEAKEWPILFLKSIPVGVDLNKIKNQFLLFIVESVLDKFDHEKFPKIKDSIENVMILLKSKDINYSDFSNAADDAYLAAYASASAASYAAADAAYVAAYVSDAASVDADAAYSAYSAYRSAYAAAAYASAAADDAYVAAYDYAAAYASAYASRESAYNKLSKKLISLIVDIKREEI